MSFNHKVRKDQAKLISPFRHFAFRHFAIYFLFVIPNCDKYTLTAKDSPIEINRNINKNT
jgi:hypothetical protein